MEINNTTKIIQQITCPFVHTTDFDCTMKNIADIYSKVFSCSIKCQCFIEIILLPQFSANYRGKWFYLHQTQLFKKKKIVYKLSQMKSTTWTQHQFNRIPINLSFHMWSKDTTENKLMSKALEPIINKYLHNLSACLVYFPPEFINIIKCDPFESALLFFKTKYSLFFNYIVNKLKKRKTFP